MIINYPLISFAKEELAVIQTISTDKNALVLSKGIKDGITKGNEVIISNDKESIVCKAIEVNRAHSLWVPLDKNLRIPFLKREIVSMNTHTFGNVSVDLGGIVSRLLPDDETNEALARIRTQNSIQLKYSYGAAITQSASSIGTTEFSKKKGQNYSLDYGFRLSPMFEIGLGGRLDYEVYRLTNPELDIPTERLFLVVSFTYHLLSFTNNLSNYYATIAMGIGNSSTIVDGNSSSGPSTILPEVRFGYLFPFTKKTAMFLEGSVESIAAQEKFEDGSDQKTTQINSKISFGMRF